jgi:hypothetical protein
MFGGDLREAFCPGQHFVESVALVEFPDTRVK